MTREKVEGSLQNRVPELIRSGQLEKKFGFQFTVQNTRFLICGNPGMVEGTFQSLSVRGFSIHRNEQPGQIITEKSF